MNNLDAQLAQLEFAQLVRHIGAEEATYMFRHALTQDAAYASLLKNQRRAIHARVAQAYEELYADRLDEYAALLAHHYTEAGDDAKALGYETRAGDQASRLNAIAETIEHYTRALDIAKRTPVNSREFLYIFERRGRAYELIGEYVQAMANYVEMDALAKQRGDRAMELASLSARATVLSTPTSAHDPKEAEILNDRALKLARELGDHAAEARTLWNLMFLARWGWQRPKDGVRFGEQSLAIAREYHLDEQIAFTLNDLGIHGYLNAGQLPEALAALEEARTHWRQMKNLPMLADSFSGSAIAYYVMGQYAEVIAASDEALRISDSIGNPWGRSYSRWIVGNAFLDRGEPERAAQAMEECIRTGEQAGFVAATVGVGTQLGMLYGHMGLPGRGVEFSRAALKIAEMQLPSWKSWCLATLARLYLLQGNVAEAKRVFEQSGNGPIESYLVRWFSVLTYQLALAEIEIAMAEKDTARAAATADSLIKHAQAIGARAILPDAYLHKGDALLLANQVEGAHAALTEARRAAEVIGARRTLWQIYAAFAEIESRRGNETEARSLCVQAREIVEYIAAHASPDLRTAFLKLDAVRAVMNPQ